MEERIANLSPRYCALRAILKWFARRPAPSESLK